MKVKYGTQLKLKSLTYFYPQKALMNSMMRE